jgi:hypothetical protein
MATSLYDLTVPTFLQGLEGAAGFLDKGLAWCHETGTDPEAIVETRLYPDMLPFRFQIQNVVWHSQGALDYVKSGVLQHQRDRAQHDYAGLQAIVAGARDALSKLTPDEVNAREGHDVLLDTPGNRRLFAADIFILSFSLPNFHFHAATAYDILRIKGVPVGKRDFMGTPRLKAKLEG